MIFALMLLPNTCFWLPKKVSEENRKGFSVILFNPALCSFLFNEEKTFGFLGYWLSIISWSGVQKLSVESQRQDKRRPHICREWFVTATKFQILTAIINQLVHVFRRNVKEYFQKMFIFFTFPDYARWKDVLQLP